MVDEKWFSDMPDSYEKDYLSILAASVIANKNMNEMQAGHVVAKMMIGITRLKDEIKRLRKVREELEEASKINTESAVYLNAITKSIYSVLDSSDPDTGEPHLAIDKVVGMIFVAGFIPN